MRLTFVFDIAHHWEQGGVLNRVWELARRSAADNDVQLDGMHYLANPAVMEREGISYHGIRGPKQLYDEGRRAIPPDAPLCDAADASTNHGSI